MATKKCPQGHVYDSNIYGDNCPFCPSHDSGKTQINSADMDGHTMVNNGMNGSFSGDEGATMATVRVGEESEGHTIIRRSNSAEGEASDGQKLVGLLVTYDTDPMGKIYEIREGRTLIGRAQSNNICINTDSNLSSTHLLILYVPAEGIFWAEDQKSSNGTFINGNFARGLTELHTNDLIVIGATKLRFIAIPQV